MNTKLTLRMDEILVKRAKAAAAARGKSVSQMVGEFFDSIGKAPPSGNSLPPVTASLVGILKGQRISEAAYRKHLKEKHG